MLCGYEGSAGGGRAAWGCTENGVCCLHGRPCQLGGRRGGRSPRGEGGGSQHRLSWQGVVGRGKRERHQRREWRPLAAHRGLPSTSDEGLSPDTTTGVAPAPDDGTTRSISKGGNNTHEQLGIAVVVCSEHARAAASAHNTQAPTRATQQPPTPPPPLLDPPPSLRAAHPPPPPPSTRPTESRTRCSQSGCGCRPWCRARGSRSSRTPPTGWPGQTAARRGRSCWPSQRSGTR